MRHMKTVKVPAKTVEELDFVTCDLCGERITRNRGDLDEVTLELRTGWSYPEGGSGEYQEYDVCGNCWRGKIVPWLRGQGAEMRRREWEF